MQNEWVQHLRRMTRRELLSRTGVGFGAAALSWLLSSEDCRSGPIAATKSFAVPPRAKSMIHLHMVGAPSQLELFEDKPVLRKKHGEPCPQEFLEGKRFAFLRGHPKLMGSKFKFRQHGESGMVFSELLPHLSKLADDVAIIKTLKTEEFNHGPAQLFMHTGFGRFGRPSMGSWISYGLGSETRDLPAYVVMVTGQVAGAGNSLWGSGFLPSVHQGIEFRSQGDPVLFLSNPKGIDAKSRRRLLDSIQFLNQKQLEDVGDPEIATRIEQYELAFRMQSSVPDLMNLKDEPEHILKRYGAEPGKATFANNCLLARRLVERGVRFVQLFDQGWDHHSNVFQNMPKKCKQIDQPLAALIEDLKERGLLDETMVMWGGEFGRTPMLQGQNPTSEKAGRDHHKEAFCTLLAGGGVKPGAVIGETDELGYNAVRDPVHVHDLHATILHLLGMDHTKLTFKYQGRQYRLTDVAGRLVKSLLA